MKRWEAVVSACLLHLCPRQYVGKNQDYWHYLSLIVQLPVVSDSVTLGTAALQASLSFTLSLSLLKLMSIESMMPFNHLILSHPLLLLPSIFPSIRVFPNESVLCIRWPKYWSFSFSISSSNEYSELALHRNTCSLFTERCLWKMYNPFRFLARIWTSAGCWNIGCVMTHPPLELCYSENSSLHQSREGFLLLRRRELSGQGRPRALEVWLLSALCPQGWWGREGYVVSRLKRTGPGSVNQPQQVLQACPCES